MKANGNYFEYLAQELLRLSLVSAEYTGKTPNWLEKTAMAVVIRALRRFSDFDSGSDHLLCFGLHVVARKNL